MPPPAVDHETKIKILESKLQSFAERIRGLSEVGAAAKPTNDADFSFESRLDANEKDLENFDKAWEDLRSLKITIGKSFPDEDLQHMYDCAHDELQTARAIHKRIQRQLRNEGPLLVPHLDPNITLAGPSAKAHLPKIPIPQFHGDITRWTHFKDVYVSLVHNEAALSNIEKFHYLLGALRGEALALISGLPVEDGTYQQAWEKLTRTFGNTRILGSLLLQRIIDCDMNSSKNESQRYELFLTGVADSIQAFTALELEDPAEFILSSLALRALDPETRRQFELTLKSDSPHPKSGDVVEFVRQRKIALKMSAQICASSSRSSPSHSSKPKYPNRWAPQYNSVSLHSATEHSSFPSKPPLRLERNRRVPVPDRNPNKPPSSLCLQCSGNHHLARCDSFKRLDLARRQEAVRGWKVCFNCLTKGHSLQDCKSQVSCWKCHRKHHTLLHPDSTNPATDHQQNTIQEKTQLQSPLHTSTFIGFGSSTSSASTPSTVLLGTTRVLLKGRRGEFHSVRAVLDSGSQQSFVTSALARRIGAGISPFEGCISSLAQSTVPKSHLKGIISCCILPSDGSQQLETQPVVVDRITSALPAREISCQIVDSLMQLPLADFGFHEPAPVELLIGGDLYPLVITGAPKPAGVEGLYLTPSIFGLVVTGKVTGTPEANTLSLFTESHSRIEEQLKAFWELEEPASVERTHPEDVLCEEHFLQTHSRTSEGRYVVRLPFRRDFTHPGFNRDQVRTRFLTLEQKLKRSSMLRLKYSEFMQEYIDLGHMSHTKSDSSYLIPHHGVWQQAPHGPKLRVVFDASCPSSVCSLNDILLAGPKLQKDLCEILIRFRIYPIPICADLVKMYRQILVHPDDRHLQHILWRNDPAEALQEFELNTVTYGIKSSAFQALRVLKQLVYDEGANFPLASERILNDMYVDDFVSGAYSAEEAHQLQQELCGLFAKGGFSLGKWASTLPELLPSPKESTPAVSLLPFGEDNIKILGLTWNASADAFSYAISQPPSDKLTKRTMLSCIARAFDPLGLLAPVIFKAKSLIQAVWKSGIGWDDELSIELAVEWMDLTREWAVLASISIPRYISLENPSFQIVGFCDASSKGYSAALYLRAEDKYGIVKVSLVKAKTKVAPLKFVSISRLELCGAFLLSRLVTSIPSQLAKEVICFTDSRVALAWINTPTHSLKVFEANRVSQIISVIPTKFWRHVSSHDNPADLASRGCNPRALKADQLWWNGPVWLTSPIYEWFQPNNDSVVLTNIVSSAPQPVFYDWTRKFSSYLSLVRTVARMLRWHPTSSSRPHVKFLEPISAKEFSEAEIRIFSFVQRLEFPKAMLSSKCPSSYSDLSPFLDERGILRVGGRLQNSPLEFSTRHPILLPPKSWLARLVVEHIHRANFHAGPGLTLSLLRGRYWIPSAPKLIRSRVTQCVRCRLSKAKPPHPLMAPLPKERFLAVRAFLQTGVDYAGPFLIKESTRRNAKISKAYLCLFVCLSSKALHLELVSSLSTPAFLATLERFMARRGAPSTMWSDHGTNFIGASRFLKDLYKFQQQAQPAVIDKLAPAGVEWKLIPPRAPHFGGLWEAGIKSVKGLLASSIGKQASTFEELTTALAKIEALLNSRPLCQLTEDPESFEFLTPGHFLIGASLSNFPEPPPTHFKESTLKSRWEQMQAKITCVWERWRKEYLHSLQQRKKWKRDAPGFKSGDLVIMLERRSIVGSWPVGRITNTYSGRDGITRVVEVRTPSGKTLTRAVTSLAPLFHPSSMEDTK